MVNLTVYEKRAILFLCFILLGGVVSTFFTDVKDKNISSEISSESLKVNINRAKTEDLQELPYIGEKIAERIVRYRKEHGVFKDYSELLNVKGIGPKILEKIKRYITLE